MGTIKVLPPFNHCANNPVSLIVGKGENKGDTCTVTVRDPFSGKTEDVEGEYINGEALFDLSTILKKNFHDGIRAEIGADNFAWVDKNVYFQWQLLVDNEPYMGYFNAFNSVAQVGYSSDLNEQGTKFLTGFQRLKKYEGYPLELSLRWVEEDIGHIHFNGNKIGVIGYPILNIRIPDNVNTIEVSDVCLSSNILTNAGFFIFANTGEYITSESMATPSFMIVKNIEHPCNPDSPFYIRWLNLDGGTEYYMFQRNQVINISTSSGDQYYTPHKDIKDVSYVSRELDKEGEKVVTAGAEDLTEWEYCSLCKLPLSPKIEYYNKELEKWIRVQVEKFDQDTETKDPIKAIEIDFKFPELQLQY